jgi:general secretion pathway protein D
MNQSRIKTMKTISTILVTAVFTARAFAQQADAPPSQAVSAPVTSTQPAAPMNETNGTGGGIRLNFNNAPLSEVLKYLSDAAGFHIVMDAPARGNVTVISQHPMTKDEAVTLLNSVLNKNGMAALRNGQFLTIVDRNEAKSQIPVNIYPGDPTSIPKSAELVTEIIPIRFVEARQLISDLSPFVSAQATIVANEAGNSILITDTQANIRHLVEIINAVDSSAESSTELRVFPLKNANPTDVANLLTSVFAPQGTTGGATTPLRFAGGRGGFGGGGRGGFGGGGGGRGGFGGGGANPFAALFGGQGNSAQSATEDRIRKQNQVTAVADLRTSAVVVTAQKDLMDQIADVIHELDVPSERDAKVTMIHLEHADPQQVATILQSAFGSSQTGRGGASSSQNSALMQREQYNASQMGSSSSSGSSIMGNNRGVGGGGGGGRGVGGGGF